ncbi:NUDIX hydrolase [Neobacillus cucumis]|uniref:NUDIX hydrolase n=1 Tax=Neobacillus cucumis TaxID=1740721 RepID=UPI0028533D15|nr:NUDIX domain-containing protein [Neobacillus cucumis]MDR4946458.1 NUDIX domain-containing protein [Neobacillus cucumis]
MGYIEDLRSLVGNRPLILNSALVIFKNEKGEVLLVFRNDTNNWGLIGGYMELGETFEETVKREINEELNTSVNSLNLYGIFSGKEFFHEYPNGDKVFSVIALFETNSLNEAISVDHQEVSKYQFFNKNDLPNNMTKVTKLLLQIYFKE